MSEHEIKEKNRIRAQLTRKRKKKYYKNLDEKNKLLEEENKRLKELLEQYERKEYKTVLDSEESLGFNINDMPKLDQSSSNGED